MANIYTAKKTIRGKEYTAQFNGLSAFLTAIDGSYVDGTNNTSIFKLASYVFEHVIVEPKGLTVDDFDDIDELNEVVRFGNEVMQGKFRKATDEGTTGAKSK